jgi:hypothetical protein
MKKKTLLHFSLAVAFCLVASLAKSQTADDAIMMGKKQCIPAGKIIGREH